MAKAKKSAGSAKKSARTGKKSVKVAAAAQRRIARDETRHAALAWSVRDGCRSRTDADGAALSAAMRGAVDALAASIEVPVPAALVDELGLPRRDDARRLFASLRASIGADA